MLAEQTEMTCKAIREYPNLREEEERPERLQTRLMELYQMDQKTAELTAIQIKLPPRKLPPTSCVN